MVIKYILSVMFPCPPAIVERAAEQRKHALEQLHLLELQHLDTLVALERYKHLKSELQERVHRLEQVATH